MALITFAVIGTATIVTDALTAASEMVGFEGEDVERYQSGETMYAFYSALEIYNDDRYGDQCSSEYAQGCWQMALFTVADCDAMEIELGFTNDIDAIAPEHVEIVERTGVIGHEATIVVFGNDEYDYGWISEVTCLDTPS